MPTKLPENSRSQGWPRRRCSRLSGIGHRRLSHHWMNCWRRGIAAVSAPEKDETYPRTPSSFSTAWTDCYHHRRYQQPSGCGRRRWTDPTIFPTSAMNNYPREVLRYGRTLLRYREERGSRGARECVRTKTCDSTARFATSL